MIFTNRVLLYTILMLLFLGIVPLTAVDIEQDIIDRAESCLGTPYVYGGVTRTGFDCSGFVYYIYKDLLNGWPRVAREQARQGVAVNKNALEPGDLTFWATGSDPRKISHVSIYLGNDSMIHALSEGPRRGIAVSSMSSRYWTPKYLFSRRIFAASAGSGSGGSGTGGSGGGETPQASGVVEKIFARGRYVGQLSGNKPHGTGTYYLNNGDVYEGQFRYGLYHGPGKYTALDGNIWEGDFVSGKLHGDAVRTWPSGSRYEGSYENGLESGGWFRSAETGKTRWILRNRTGQWEVFENSDLSMRMTDSAPAPSVAEAESVNYLLKDNPWDDRVGTADIPSDWETGPLFEESYIQELEAFEEARNREREAFDQYRSGN